MQCVAAAAAKSLQSCPTLCDPIDGSPPGSSVPGILQARILEWVAISFSLYAVYIMHITRLDEAQAGIKTEVKAFASNLGDLGSIPGSGRSPGEGNGNPLQYSCLENPMEGGAW